MAIFSLLRGEAQPSEIREMATFFWQTVAFIVYQEKSKWVFIEAPRKREKGDKEAVAQWFEQRGLVSFQR